MLSVFNKKNTFYGTKTFTYYLPAPPARKSGYQEREFDTLTNYLHSLGFELIDIKIQAHSSKDQAGLWLICILGAKTKKVFETTIDYDYAREATNFSQDHHIPQDPDIIHDA